MLVCVSKYIYDNAILKHDTYDKKNQIIDDHIIFTNVVSNKNTDFQLYIFRGLNLIVLLCFNEMRNILGYEKKILLVNY